MKRVYLMRPSRGGMGAGNGRLDIHDALRMGAKASQSGNCLSRDQKSGECLRRYRHHALSRAPGYRHGRDQAVRKEPYLERGEMG
jgi:hypothetical protein